MSVYVRIILILETLPEMLKPRGQKFGLSLETLWLRPRGFGLETFWPLPHVIAASGARHR